MGIEFYQTGYGRKFFEADLPKLIRAIEKVGNELEKFNTALTVDKVVVVEEKVEGGAG